MSAIANLVQQKTASTGNGPMLLSLVAGCRSFSSAFGTGGSDMFFYFIRHRSAPEWEVGTGHMADAGTLVRDNVISSSSGGAKVAFSAGEKDVVNDIAAERQMVLPAAPALGDMLVFDGLRWQAAKPEMSAIDGLAAALAAKAAAVHSHAAADITGLGDALAGKAGAVHTHALADVSGLDAALLGKAAAAHTHGASDITGLSTALAAKADSLHRHEVEDIDALAETLAGFALAEHTHATDEVTGLDAALATKSALGHSHAISDVTNLTTTLAGKAAASHSHAPSDISGLESMLAAKAPTSRSIATAGSLTGGGTLGGDLSLSLSGDHASPGSGKYYGTDASGAKGFYALPAVAETPDAADIPFDSAGRLLVTASDVQSALAQADLHLQSAGFHPARTVHANHFTGADIGPFVAATSGTSANAATLETDLSVNTDALGVFRLTTGTTAAGAAWRSLGAAALVPHASGKRIRIKSRIRIATLTASGSQEFRVWGGLTVNTAATTNPASVIGMCWYYDKDNANWVLRRRNATATYDVATDVAVEAGVWYDMELVITGSETDTNVTGELFINGVSKAVNTQLVGSLGYNAVSVALQKAVGTTARLLYIDYEALFMERLA